MRVRDEARVNQMQPIHLVSVLLLLALVVTFGAGTLYTILETKRVRAAHPPAGQFISVEGTRLHYASRVGDAQCCCCMVMQGSSRIGLRSCQSWRHTTVCSRSIVPATAPALAPPRAM